METVQAFASPSFSSQSTTESGRHGKINRQWVLYKFSSGYEYILMTFGTLFSVESFFAFNYVNANENDATLLHYFLCYIFIGLPLIQMQTLLGQYSQLAIIHFKHLSPIGHGIGYVMLTVTFMTSCWCGNLTSDFVMFILACFRYNMEWMSCPPNSEDRCWDPSRNCTHACVNSKIQTSASIFWREIYMNNVDMQGTDISLGSRIGITIVPLIAIWAITASIASSGIQRYKKLIRLNIYLIATLIGILLLVSLITNGSITGVAVMFKMNPYSFITTKPWITAMSSMINLLAIGTGVHMLYGACLPPSMSADILIFSVVVLSFVGTLIATMVSQAVLGITMKETHVEPENLKYLWYPGNTAFLTVMPQGLGFMGVPQLWTVIYLLTGVLLGINNLITFMDIVTKSLAEAHYRLRVYRNYMLAGFAILASLAGILLFSKEAYVAAEILFLEVERLIQLCILSLMSILAFWVYTVQRLSDDIHFLQGAQPTKFWKIIWYIIPAIFMYMSLEVLIAYAVYSNKRGAFRYFTICIWLLPIPCFLLYEVFRYLKTHNLMGLCQPEERWGPPDPEERRLRHLFNPRQEIRSRRRDDSCQHKCLIGNKFLKKAVEDERKLDLEIAQLCIIEEDRRQSLTDTKEAIEATSSSASKADLLPRLSLATEK